MNPEPVLSWLKNFGGALTKSLTPTQLLSLLLTFAAVVSLTVGAAYWITTPTYRVLFSDLDPESAANVVEELQGSQIRYELDPGGRTVRVPAPQLDELRLRFASQGMPESGRIGFEIFDRTAFGATEFLEQVNFRRALEGEIARTIASLDEVDGARVHIAMAQKALFGRTEQPAKASVVLKLRSTHEISEESVRGISNLVAAGVEGLTPDAVVLIDSYGRPFSTSSGAHDEGTSGHRAERRNQLEQDMTQRVLALLEPVAGVGRVRANVAVDLSSESEEATEESWDPATSVVRSRHVTGDSEFLAASAIGTAGAQSNLPPRAVAAVAPLEPETPAPDAVTDLPDADLSAEGTDLDQADGSPESAPNADLQAALAGTPAARGSETTNYEISKSVRHVVRPAGDIARLSVAVILDDRLIPDVDEDGEPIYRPEPRAPEDIEKVRSLVAAAVGFSPDRGDLLTVENISFEETLETEFVAPPVWQRFLPQIMEGARIVAAVLLTLVLFQFGLRPMVGRATAALSTGQTAGGERIAGGQVPSLEGIGQQGKIDALSTHANTISSTEPEAAARLVRAWLAEEKR